LLIFAVFISTELLFFAELSTFSVPDLLSASEFLPFFANIPSPHVAINPAVISKASV